MEEKSVWDDLKIVPTCTLTFPFQGETCLSFLCPPVLTCFHAGSLAWCGKDAPNRKWSWLKACGISSHETLASWGKKSWRWHGPQSVSWEPLFLIDSHSAPHQVKSTGCPLPASCQWEQQARIWVPCPLPVLALSPDWRGMTFISEQPRVVFTHPLPSSAWN